MQFDRVHRSAPECTVGGGGTRGGYYQHRLEWRSWLPGRSFAQGLSQRRNDVTTFNISTVKSWRIHGEILSLSIAYPDCTLTPNFKNREGPPGWAEHPLRTGGFEIKLNGE